MITTPEPRSSKLHDEEQHQFMIFDPRLPKLVSLLIVLGTAVFAGYFFGFVAYQSVFGKAEPTNWVIRLVSEHWPALIGTPLSAITAFCVVSLLRVANGPIEFEALGFKFRGASGPVVLWVFCFLAVTCSLFFLWKCPAP